MTPRLSARHSAAVLALACASASGQTGPVDAAPSPQAPDAPALGEAPANGRSGAPATPRLERVEIFGKRRPTPVGPLPGLDISRDQIPSAVQSLNARDIKRAGGLGVADVMASQLQSVSVNDTTGNPLQRDVNFRGFTAGPQIGTPQGLSVFFDGVRVNEPFGDVVNWDLIPMNAVDRMDLYPGANPLFGLNTLGGALSLRSKSGFTAPGLETTLTTGSFGRKKFELSLGLNEDDDDDDAFAGFGALSLLDERGWRDNSPSRVGQFFGRVDWRGFKDSATATVLLADNNLIGNGLVPLDLWHQRPQSVFTAPDQSLNRLTHLTLSGTHEIDRWFNVTAQVYRRNSRRAGVNGDVYEGFQDLLDSPRRLQPQALPVCAYLDANGDGVRDSDSPLNGPEGSGCSAASFGPNGDGPRNGGHITGSGSLQTPTSGVIAGTPIGLMTRTDLGQVTDGVGVQLNGNLETHKLMLGAGLDRNRADYRMAQQLGLIDASHRVYLDPAGIDPEFYAGRNEVLVNAFDGDQRHGSLYFSDTWSVRDNLHLSFAGRYNRSQVNTRLQTRAATAELAEVGRLRDHVLCGSADPASCEAAPSVYVPPEQRSLAPTVERLSYQSFNPSVGFNWLPSRDTNVFGSLSRGTRVPSVVELGCAFDPTLVPLDPNNPQFGQSARSLVGPTCSLPTALSGDPYLPQIRATAGEVGVRGRVAGWDWNAGLFRTDLKNDLYFVGVGDGRSYFDTIGKTRRQGLELGLKGRAAGAELSFNYSYVDATFRSPFYMVSPHNSSANFDQNSRSVTSDPGLLFGQQTLPTAGAGANRGFGSYHMIRVEPGAKLPGIPQHNVNASVAMQPLAGLRLTLSMIARSGSFMRGNENNAHQAAGTDQETGQYVCNTGSCANGLSQLAVSAGRPFTQPGRIGGFAIFNLDVNYEVTKGLTLMLQVGNLFNRQYLTAGRLGINPYAPSTVGAIGPSGWNYNAAEWRNSSFVGPGAPRGFWVGLNWALGEDE